MLDNIFLVDTRCYIAGVLMPVLSITIKNAMHEIPRASITLPADIRLLEVGRYDRVPVQVFQRETMVDAPNFILIFEGIIASRNYVNTAVDRSITIECIGILDFLADVKIKFMSSVEDMCRRGIAGESSISMSVNSSTLPFPTYFFRHGLGHQDTSSTDSTTNGITYPTEYLKNMYEYLLYAVHNEKKSLVGPENSSELAAFFGSYAKMIRLVYRYMPIIYFDGMLNNKADQNVFSNGVFPVLTALLKNNDAMLVLEKVITDNASNHTCRELLDLVCDQMEYEFLTITNPAYLPKKDSYTIEIPKDMVGNVTEGRLLCSTLKPIFSESLPVMCNVVYRSQVSRLTCETPFKGQATRVQVHDDTNLIYNFITREDETLAKLATTFVYPYEDINTMISSGNNTYTPGMAAVAAFVLNTEKFTGPWVAETEVPAWWKWVQQVTDKKSDPITEQTKAIRNVFFQRQLIQSQYVNRSVSVDTSFNPYITVGFPGVVFDSADTNLSFCGYVIAVEHSITPDTVATMYSMNYVRTLHEASAIRIMHPVKELDDIYNDKSKMTDVYQCMLGVPKHSSAPKPKGANAEQYSTLLDNFINEDITNSDSPQNNPKKAYEAQRRNICTFEQYLEFQGLRATYDIGPEGPNTPIKIGGDDFIDKRAPVIIYSRKTKGDFNNTTTQKTEEGNAATNNGDGWKEANAKELLPNSQLFHNTVEAVRESGKSNLFASEEQDLISVLSDISKEQFSKIIYK